MTKQQNKNINNTITRTISIIIVHIIKEKGIGERNYRKISNIITTCYLKKLTNFIFNTNISPLKIKCCFIFWF